MQVLSFTLEFFWDNKLYSRLGEEPSITQLGQTHSQPNTWLPRWIHIGKTKKHFTWDWLKAPLVRLLFITPMTSKAILSFQLKFAHRINQVELESLQTLDIHSSNSGEGSSYWFYWQTLTQGKLEKEQLFTLPNSKREAVKVQQ